jgi:hypothetical protein
VSPPPSSEAVRTPAWSTVNVRHSVSWNWFWPAMAVAVAVNPSVGSAAWSVSSWYQPFLLVSAPCSSSAAQLVAAAMSSA